MEKTAVENDRAHQASQGLSNAGVAAYRTLRVLGVLLEHTGETQAISVDEIARLLENPEDGRQPVCIHRKSLFSTISALRAAGYEIEFRRGAGYRLLTRPLSDEDVVRLHGMVMRNRTAPKEVRYNLACRLIGLASADIRPYLEPPRTEEAHAATKRIERETPKVGICELIERAIEAGVPVDFDLMAPPWCESEEGERCTMQPFALKQWNGASFMLGTIPDSSGGDGTLRTVQVARMRSVSCMLPTGSKLIATDAPAQIDSAPNEPSQDVQETLSDNTGKKVD